MKKMLITLSFIILFIGTTYGESNKITKIKGMFLQTISNELKLLNNDVSKKRDNPKVFWAADNAWHAIYTEWSNEYSYDIIASNSIMSPYLGIVTFHGKVWEKVGKTEGECLKAAWKPQRLGNTEVKVQRNLKYAYRDEEWVLIEKKGW